jgi:two-component system, NtrC family, sensor kinase
MDSSNSEALIKALAKENRILQRQLDRSEIERAQLEETNERRQRVLKQAATESESARLELEKAFRNLQVMKNKMSSLGMLIAGVAHEINNPLGFVEGNLLPITEYCEDLLALVDLFCQHYPDPGTTIQAKIKAIDLGYLKGDLMASLTSMEHGIERIRQISSSLRIVARADAERPIKTDLHDVLESALLILKHRCKATETMPAIALNRDYGELPTLACYPGPLSQVMINLVGNAIDALQEMAWSLDQTPAITVSTLEESDHLTIAIADNGPGIPADIIDQIFDPTFTTKTVGKGTGLGLAIAKDIIQDQHQGTLTCQSHPGIGTTFTITLPI